MGMRAGRVARRALALGLAVAVGMGAGADVSPECGLNGEWAGGGAGCRCRPGWEGRACERLAVAAGGEGSGVAYPPPERLASTSSWGGSVVYDEGDGAFHLFASEFRAGCGLDSWFNNSAVVHAVSAGPEGPYEKVGEVAAPFAHNPRVVRAPGGEYVLYHIHEKCCRGPADMACSLANSEVATCEGGVTPVEVKPTCPLNGTTTDNGHPGYAVSVAWSCDPAGPWERKTILRPSRGLGAAFRVNVDNPAPYIFPDGSALVLVRGWNGRDAYPARRDAIGVAYARHWQGEYTLADAPALEGLEDPFLWRDEATGTFHALFHGMRPGATPEEQREWAGRHAFSRDGFDWRLFPGAAYNSTTYAAAGPRPNKRRERPHLLFRDGRPAYLFTGVVPLGAGDKAFTHIQKLHAG